MAGLGVDAGTAGDGVDEDVTAADDALLESLR